MKGSPLTFIYEFAQVADMPLLRSLAECKAVGFYTHGAPNGAWRASNTLAPRRFKTCHTADRNGCAS